MKSQFTNSKFLKNLKLTDKLSHIGVTFMLCAFLDTWFGYLGGPQWLALSSALIIGLLRELMQANKNGKFNYLDMIANIMGFIAYVFYLDIL